jgi:predicted transcriptional regulator
VFNNSLYESTSKWETNSDFQRGQIVGAPLAGASVTKTATLLGESRAAVSKVMTTYTNHVRTSSAKRNSGQKQKLSGRNCRTLKRIVTINHRSTTAKVTAEINIRFKNVSTKTV